MPRTICTTAEMMGACGLALGLTIMLANSAMAQGTTFTKIQHGRYLTKVGDCMACHTAKGGKPFAGGFPVPTPFGTIFSTNITPDDKTGIGKWSSQDFYNAMHLGIRRDGKNLYPAFPYPWFTKLSRADVDAIKAYLDTLTPVRQKNKPVDLPWPLSWRLSVKGWNTLYFDPGQYTPKPDKSDLWNRGAYLIKGPAHCAACHTAKNMLGATKDDKALQGGDAGEGWYAPSLGSNNRDGIGKWTVKDIVQYLKTGANSKSAAAGPMIDVIMKSTQHLSDNDLKAMAVYLKDLPSDSAKADDGNATQSGNAKMPDKATMARGQALYTDNCTACHMARGKGQPNTFPPLQGNPSVQSKKPDSLIHIILAGMTAAAPAMRPTGLTMPGFAWKFDDKQVADLVTYLRNSWGNRASAASEDQVAKIRKTVRANGKGLKGGLTQLN